MRGDDLHADGQAGGVVAAGDLGGGEAVQVEREGEVHEPADLGLVDLAVGERVGALNPRAISNAERTEAAIGAPASRCASIAAAPSTMKVAAPTGMA